VFDFGVFVFGFGVFGSAFGVFLSISGFFFGVWGLSRGCFSSQIFSLASSHSPAFRLNSMFDCCTKSIVFLWMGVKLNRG